MADHLTTPSSFTTCLDLTISVPGFASSSSFPSSAGEGSSMRDFDMNKVPLRDEEEEEAEWNMRMMTAPATGGGGGGGSTEEQEEEGEYPTANGGRPRKKLRLSKEQSRLLEESFRLNHTLNPRQKEGLAMHLKLKPRQVEVWFQNRRARSKLKQTEMECEYLRRWYGSLTEQNRRLKKEVEELRVLKMGPSRIMTPNSRDPLPASTLTMCPRCERVTTTAALAYASNSTSASTNIGPVGKDTGARKSTIVGANNNNNNNNQNDKNVRMSAKVPFLQSRQSSAAC